MKIRLVISGNELNELIRNIADKIVKNNPTGDNLVLVGVQRGGVYLAERIKSHLDKALKTNIPLGKVDIGMYRDDLNHHLPPAMQPSQIPVDINDKNVILIDDVLFSGRTTRAALDALNDFGRPARVQLAVLIDRGHRELPIAADYVGKVIETTKEEKVKVLFKESDGEDAVVVESPE